MDRNSFVRLGPNSLSCCPVCGRTVAFFSGELSAFRSEEKTLLSDSPVLFKCPEHGTFEVPAQLVSSGIAEPDKDLE